MSVPVTLFVRWIASSVMKFLSWEQWHNYSLGAHTFTPPSFPPPLLFFAPL